MRTTTTMFVLMGALLAIPAQGQPLTTAFSYQGELTSGGAPAGGQYDMRFRLYDAASGGAQIGTTLCSDALMVAGGQFSVSLDFGAQFAGQQRYLEIEVRPDTGLACGDDTGFVTLIPRQAVTAAPNALFSLSAATAASAAAADTATTATTAANATQLNGQGASFYLNAANLAGGPLPSAQLSGVYSAALTLSNPANAFSGVFSGSGAGLAALSATNVTSGTLDSLRLPVPLGLSGASTTHIVRAENTSATDLASGLLGVASAASGGGCGVQGISSSTAGTGVYGSSAFRGVYGTTTSTTVSGAGVMGSASGGARGVYGESTSAGGVGVFGFAGVATGASTGVYGASGSPTGFGVFSSGNMGASGTKSFRIDHPADPENKYLLHYAAESPEIINFYRGTVTIDPLGEAVVVLPAYFARINKTPSYQLTAVGAPMPMLHVADEISDEALDKGSRAEPGQDAPLCSFRIAGGVPGAKVSWEVMAVRNDRWVQKYGAPVEVAKEGLEKGTYQHPDLYNQPLERARTGAP